MKKLCYSVQLPAPWREKRVIHATNISGLVAQRKVSKLLLDLVGTQLYGGETRPGLRSLFSG